MSLSRRGAGLLELLAALSISMLLAALTARIMASAALHLRDRSERMASEQALRAGAAAVRAAVESLGHDSVGGADLLAMAPTSLTVRATRVAGTVCAASGGLIIALGGPTWWSALRAPVAGRDSILAGRIDAPAWRVYALSASPRGALCPDGSSGVALPIPGSAPLGGIGPGSPLRVFENVELRLYRSAPDDWLGLRLLSGAQAIQPFAGPMSPAGLVLGFEGRDGLPAALPAHVAAVRFRLAALTERAGGVGLFRGRSPRGDSLSGFVALGNP